MIKKLLAILFLLIMVIGFVVPGVLAVGAAPIAVNDEYNVQEGNQLDTSADGSPSVLLNDTDADTPSGLTARQRSPVSHGFLSFSANGHFIYVPERDYAGTDTFTYDAYDGETYSNVATVTITIENVNTPPTLNIPDRSVEKNSG